MRTKKSDESLSIFQSLSLYRQLLFIVLLACSSPTFAQYESTNQINDSLRALNNRSVSIKQRINTAREVYKASDSLDYPPGKLYSCLHLGTNYMMSYSYNVAHVYFNNANLIAAKEKDSMFLRDTYRMLTSLELLRNDFDRAMEYWHQYRSYVDKMGSIHDTVLSDMMLAGIQFKQKKKSETLKTIRRIERNRKLLDIEQPHVQKHNIVVVGFLVYTYTSYGNQEKVDFYEKELKRLTADGIDKQMQLELNKYNYLIAKEKGEYKNALYYAQLNAKQAYDMELYHYYVMAMDFIIKLHNTNDNYKEGAFYYDSLSKFKQYGGIITRFGDDELSTILVKQQETEDSLTSLKTTVNQLSTEKEESQNSMLIIVIITTVIAIAILTILRIRYNSRVKNTKVKNKQLMNEIGKMSGELEHHKKEVSNISLALSKQLEFTEEVRQKIAKLKQNGLTDDQASNEQFSNLLSQLNAHLQNNRDQELLHKSMELSSSFFYNLKSHHPNLLPSEQNLCALVRIGLTNKQIATVQNIQADSVKVKKYRLFKKMGFSTVKELQAFLMSLSEE